MIFPDKRVITPQKSEKSGLPRPSPRERRDLLPSLRAEPARRMEHPGPGRRAVTGHGRIDIQNKQLVGVTPRYQGTRDLLLKNACKHVSKYL